MEEKIKEGEKVFEVAIGEESIEETPEEPFAEIIQAKEKLDAEAKADFELVKEKLETLSQPLTKQQEKISRLVQAEKEISGQLDETTTELTFQQGILAKENKKNFFSRIFSKTRKEAEKQFEFLNQKIIELQKQNTQLNEAEQNLKDQLLERETTNVQIIKEIINKINSNYESFKSLIIQNEKLKSELNEQLIAEKIIPELEKTNFDQKQRDEFLELIKWRLQLQQKEYYRSKEQTKEELKQAQEKSAKLYS